MSRVTDMIATRLRGGEKPADEESPGLPPFLLALLRQVGLSPEAVSGVVEQLKNAVGNIAENMGAIRQGQLHIEERLDQLENHISQLELTILEAQRKDDPVAIPLDIPEMRLCTCATMDPGSACPVHGVVQQCTCSQDAVNSQLSSPSCKIHGGYSQPTNVTQ